jgi:hypothetical protein
VTFGLIPIGWLLIAIRVILGIILGMQLLLHRPKKSDKWIFGLSLGFIVSASLYFEYDFYFLPKNLKRLPKRIIYLSHHANTIFSTYNKEIRQLF